MREDRLQNPEMYEGLEPYIFISYSHKDHDKMDQIKASLSRLHMRFWYDSGLHSGDDWNLVIAQRLEKAAVCLLLLSRESASSTYVKNELNFAQNHRIPIHTIMLESFEIPVDIELMVGRIQAIIMKEGYEQELFNALPPELIDQPEQNDGKEADRIRHPLYEIGEKLLERQGSTLFSGVHKTLKYPVLIQKDLVKRGDPDKLIRSAATACALEHPLFIGLIDAQVTRGYMWSYMNHHKVVFLDDYLKEKQVDEKTIENWIEIVVDGMEYLLQKGYAIADFARGSLVVTDDTDIRIMRLHNGYYGVLQLRQDTRQYYVENEIQEIAALLYQLCTGETPILPFPIIRKSHVSEAFLKKANLIIQKATKEQGRVSYTSFKQMKEDLSIARISLKDRRFLSQREKKLEQYQKAKAENELRFTADDASPFSPEDLHTFSLEEAYGFDATVAFSAPPSPEKPLIRILICSSKSVLSFSQSSIVIGRGDECDVKFTQFALSRRHAMVTANGDGTFLVTDLNSTNGTSYGKDNIRLAPGESVTLPAGSLINVAGIELKLMAPE